MIDYVFTKQARMKFLCNYLGDEFSDNIKSGCDNTSEKKLTPIEDYQLREKLKEFHETYFPPIKCVQRYNNIIDGVAASYYGVSNAAGLDPKGRDEILDQIAKIHKERGITVILVSHSMEDVANYVQRIIVMNDGEVALDDVPKRVFRYAKG